jgi:hypothetical protein
VAAWTVQYTGTKTVTAKLAATTINDVVGMDPGPALNRGEPTLVSHFNAAIASAQAAIASLTGPAGKVSIQINGYRDTNTVGKPYDTASRITVMAVELW